MNDEVPYHPQLAPPVNGHRLHSFEQMQHVYELRQRGWSRLKVSRVTGVKINTITSLCQRYRRLLREGISS